MVRVSGWIVQGVYWLYILCNRSARRWWLKTAHLWAHVLLLEIQAGSVGFLSGFHEATVTGWALIGAVSQGRTQAHWVVRWIQFPVVMGLRSLTPCWLCAGPSLLLEALLSPQPTPSPQFPVLLLWSWEWHRLTQIIQDYLLILKSGTSARLHFS